MTDLEKAYAIAAKLSHMSIEKDARVKMAQTDRSYLIGSKWWNNGIKCKRSHEQPDMSWVPGRLKKLKE